MGERMDREVEIDLGKVRELRAGIAVVLMEVADGNSSNETMSACLAALCGEAATVIVDELNKRGADLDEAGCRRLMRELSAGVAQSMAVVIEKYIPGAATFHAYKEGP